MLDTFEVVNTVVKTREAHSPVSRTVIGLSDVHQLTDTVVVEADSETFSLHI